MKFYFLILLLYPIAALAQSYPTPYEIEVVDTSLGTKQELFSKSFEWIAKKFVSANDVVQMKDENAGKIIAKGIIKHNATYGPFNAPGIYDVWFTLQVDIKDNKYRYRASDFKLIGSHWGADYHTYDYPLQSNQHPKEVPKKMWEKLKIDCWRQTIELQSDFAEHIKSQKSNW